MWAWLQEELGMGEGARGVATLADVGLKGIILMAMAGIAILLTRRRAASTRHLIWLLALVSLILLPAVSLLVPKWQIPILPSVEERSVESAEFRPSDLTPLVLTPVRVESSTDKPVASTAQATLHSGTAPPPVTTSVQTNGAPSARPKTLAFSLLVTWLAVALAVFFPLLAGTIAVARMTRRATPFPDDDLPALADILTESLGLRGRVRLLRAESRAMPMAAGFTRPIVFLPRGTESWPQEKQRAVLLHELAHVKRRDCLTHALARTAVALHWFNPLAWWALRQLRIEREHACDDLVLTAGERPTAYAEHLLDIARTMRAGTMASAAAITMAKKSHLEGRLLAVLDGARNRKELTLGLILLFIVLFTATVLLLSPIALTAPQPIDVPAYAVGKWHAQGSNVYVGATNLHMPLELQIGADGTVEGRLGDALLEDANLSRLSIPERWSYRGRHFDYKIEAHLKGQLNTIDYDGPLFIGLVDMNGEWGARPLLSLRALGEDRDGLTQLGHYVMKPHTNPYLEIFAHDVRAAVVGVRDPDAKAGPALWEPDGVPLVGVPNGFERRHGSVSIENGQVRRDFLVLVTNFAPSRQTADISVRWKVEGVRSVGGGLSKRDDQWRIDIATAFPDTQEHTTLYIGVAGGGWTNVVSGGLGGSAGASVDGRSYDVVFSEAMEKGGAYHVIVTHAKMDQDYRVVAVDHGGKTHVLSNAGSSSAGNLVQSEYLLSDLPPDDVARVEFQVRDYVWRAIPKIALQPLTGSGRIEAAHYKPFPPAILAMYNGPQSSEDKHAQAFGPSDGKATFGRPVAVSEFEWIYLGRVDEGWRFKFKRRFPADQPDIAENIARESTYMGGALAVFEDAFQWIGVEEVDSGISTDLIQSPSAADSLDYTNPYSSRFSKNLGASVVAVGEPNAECTLDSAWAPDGSPLSAVPSGYPDNMSITPLREGGVIRHFLVDIGPQANPDELAISWRINGQSGKSETSKGGNITRLSMVTELSGEDKTATLKLGIAASPWETPTDQGFPGSTVENEGYSLTFSDFFKKDNTTQITVTHPVFGQSSRLVAVDRDGTRHPTTRTYTKIVGSERQSTFVVMGEVSPDQISHVVFQTRKFVWREISGIALHPSQTQMPASNPRTEARATSNESTTPKDFTATFTSGITAHVAAIGSRGSQYGDAWRPDGALLSEIPEAFKEPFGLSSSAEGIYRQLLVKAIPAGENADISMTWRFNRGRGGSWTQSVEEDKTHLHILLKTPDENREGTLELGIAAGPWESVHGTSGPNSSVDGNRFSSAYSDFFEKDGKARVIVTHTPREDDYRLVVFDKDDTPYPTREVSSTGVGGMRQTEYVVEGDATSSQLLYMDLQARPYEWKMISGIALHPSQTARPVSIRQTEARAFMDEREARRQAILDVVSSESLEESIRMLRKRPFSKLFWISTELSMPISQTKAQEYMLHQPRVAKIMAAAVEGSQETRQKILDTVLAELTDYVEGRQRSLEGKETTTGALNGGFAFPLILAEVDRSGASLPVLLQWYEVDRTEATISNAFMASMRTAEELEGASGTARMTSMNHIASAAYEIMLRLSILEESEVPFSTVHEEPELFRPRERLASGAVPKLKGYKLNRELGSSHADRIMKKLRAYLEGQPTTSPELQKALRFNDRRAKEAVEAYDDVRPIVWGEVTEGLQAAVRLDPFRASYAMGEVIPISFLVRATGEEEVQFLTSERRSGDECISYDLTGNLNPSGTTRYSGSDAVRRVSGGSESTHFIKSASFTFLPVSATTPPEHPVGTWAKVLPGTHTLQFKLNFPDATMASGDGAPRPGDWTGTLTTGKVEVEVVEKGSSSTSPSPL
jgi:beta-lactamase regulating signal transducer with metallopeptidase domain